MEKQVTIKMNFVNPTCFIFHILNGRNYQ